MSAYQIARMGWFPDPLDNRDRSVRDAEVQNRLAVALPRLSPEVATTAGTMTSVGALRADLRRWCSPIEDQGQVGSCTAQAVVGALEYFEKKARGTHVDASRLFLYRATRRFLQWDGRGDTGAFVRSTIKALRLFGAPPERFWPYLEARFDQEPDAFVYALAQNFKAIEYFRLDESATQLKSALASGLPFAFGFTCFNSLFRADVSASGVIPYPSQTDSVVGGHAVLAVGYTDSHVLIRNSWGTDWGDRGHGYLPWSYFDRARPLATDCWALLNAAWLPDGDISEVRSRKTRAARRPARPATVQVRRGNDPARRLPLKLSPLGVALAQPTAGAPQEVSPAPVSLSIKSVTLHKSFDFQLFGKAVNELYMVAIAWDYSGRPAVVYPPPQATPAEMARATYQATRDEPVVFLGSGIEIWPAQPVTGSLNVRIFLVESDADVQATGKKLAKITEVVNGSAFGAAITALAAGTAGTVSAVVAAAAALTQVVAELMQKDEDDLVAVFDGSYGADHGFGSGEENNTQNGATISLRVKG